MLFGIEIPMYDEFRWVFVVLYFGGLVAMTIAMAHAQYVMHQHNSKYPSIPPELHVTPVDGLVRWWGLAFQVGMVAIIFMIWRLSTLNGEVWALLWVIGTLLPVIVNLEREHVEKWLRQNEVSFTYTK